jgi:ornithine carbamoyltransferase
MVKAMHLLQISDIAQAQILDLFDWADRLAAQPHENALRGKTFVLFFPESSIRTRISFETGIRRLGGDCVLFPPETLDKREQLEDVVAYIANWADGIIIRHPDFVKITQCAAYSSIPIINAMTSVGHPCEILADLYAISRRRADYRDSVYTFVGGASNIAASWKEMAEAMDLQFHHVCESGHELGEESRNYRFHTELEPVLRGSDVILTDSLPSGLRTAAYIEKYQITLGRMKLAKARAMPNPCPPFFRGEEVSAEAITSDYFVGYGFKKALT